MVARVTLEKPKSKGHRFTKGHRLSVGNAGNNLDVRRRKRFLTEGLIHILTIEDPKKRERLMDRMLKKYASLAVNGKGRADVIRDIFDRVEGKPVQAVELTGKDGAAIKTITGQMTIEEAARAYAETVEAEGDE
jgi:hypothetical protein